MDVDIPEPNPALAAVLLSPAIRAICAERANTAQWLYQSRVAKRSSALARSAHAHTEIGGWRQDRWIGVLSVHSGIEYEAAHEYGHKSRKARKPIAGAHDLNAVLEELEKT
jgi:hypothetical protein